MLNWASYVEDNERVRNTDLVAWVNSGHWHIPLAEDAPNSPATAASIGFVLRPYNYFDEDAAMYSRDIVTFRPDEEGNQVGRGGTCVSVCGLSAWVPWAARLRYVVCVEQHNMLVLLLVSHLHTITRCCAQLLSVCRCWRRPPCGTSLGARPPTPRSSFKTTRGLACRTRTTSEQIKRST